MLHVEQKLWFIADEYADPAKAVEATSTTGEQVVYWFLQSTKGSTRQDIIRWSGLSERTAERAIKRLQDAGVIIGR